jgi:hypothetical protein
MQLLSLFLALMLSISTGPPPAGAKRSTNGFSPKSALETRDDGAKCCSKPLDILEMFLKKENRLKAWKFCAEFLTSSFITETIKSSLHVTVYQTKTPDKVTITATTVL